MTPPRLDEGSEREAFEAWAGDQGFVLQRLDIGDGDNYQDLRTQGPWEAWQARAALSTGRLGGEAGLLRQALWTAHKHLEMDAMRISHCKDFAIISAAMSLPAPAAKPQGDSNA